MVWNKIFLKLIPFNWCHPCHLSWLERGKTVRRAIRKLCSLLPSKITFHMASSVYVFAWQWTENRRAKFWWIPLCQIRWQDGHERWESKDLEYKRVVACFKALSWHSPRGWGNTQQISGEGDAKSVKIGICIKVMCASGSAFAFVLTSSVLKMVKYQSEPGNTTDTANNCPGY